MERRSKSSWYFVGKVTRNLQTTGGPRNCKVYVTWALRDGRFSMCGEVWNHLKTDLIVCGQCVDTIADLFPGNARLQRMRAIWERYHLNDMRAGSPAQEAYLREHPIEPSMYAYPKSHYEVACQVLAAAGLNPDPADGYRYGSAWRREEIPTEVLAEIASWSTASVATADGSRAEVTV